MYPIFLAVLRARASLGVGIPPVIIPRPYFPRFPLFATVSFFMRQHGIERWRRKRVDCDLRFLHASPRVLLR